MPGIFAAKEHKRARKIDSIGLGLCAPSVLSRHPEAGVADMRTINELCDIVRQTSYDIHVYHAHGHLEKVYENALAHRLRKAGLNVTQQLPVQVKDEDGTIIGEFCADLLVESRLIVELKAARSFANEHVAQLLGSLKSTGIETGLLINFGSYRFEIKKYLLTSRAEKDPNQ